MTEGTTHAITEGLHVVEDPSYPQLYLMAESAGLTEDPDNSQLYTIGS